MTDTEIYARCMQKVKERIGVVRLLSMDDPLGPSNSMLTTELTFVQFRKILELIAFSSLSANKAKYSQAYENIDSQWRAKAILDSVKKLNPNFYPVPLEGPITGPEKHLVFNRRAGDFLTKEEFVELYDICNHVLHMRNPFSSKDPIARMRYKVDDWAMRIQNLLSRHLIQLVDDGTAWLVTIPGSGDVEIVNASKLGGPGERNRLP